MRHSGVVGILANGVLINPQRLAYELDQFADAVPDIADRVFISGRAHLILPLHIAVDERQEQTLNLFVLGGATFPTRGSWNPFRTMVALAIRLADHLSNRSVEDRA